MNKRKISMLLSGVMAAAIIMCSGCAGPASNSSSGGSAAGKTYAIITKSMGNPYNKCEADGFKEVIEAEGGTCIVIHPEYPTAEAQIPILQSLISQKVDAIAIAANDTSTLIEPLKEVSAAGIKICTLDSDLDAASRATFCNQTSNQLVGQILMDAVYDITGGEGQYAILSATTEATNQNAWIDAMKKIAEGDGKYANLELVAIAYGDDEADKSASETATLLADYPDLKVICAPTAAGIAAAAKVIRDQDSAVKITGLGLPSAMAEYISEDGPCPYMYLWNPIDLGRLAAYTSIALVDGTITGAVGETLEAGKMESSPYTLTALESNGSASEIIMGEPFRFTPDNIDEWKNAY